LTGIARVIVSKEELVSKAKEIVCDEVIGVSGFGNKDVIFATELFFPDILLLKPRKLKEEKHAAFIADTHVGSDKFLEENFFRFIEWLNNSEEGKKVNYLFLVGDNVDGVGIYPGQEKELAILDIYEQYKRLAELLRKIRKDVKIFICPGGHDSVRTLQPQPKIPEKFAPDLWKMENTFLLTNPARVNLSGFEILLYHGDSYDFYRDNVEGLRQKAKSKPDVIMKFLLKKRHLAPSYGSEAIIPTKEDSLVIKSPPDLFVSAHVHKNSIASYNNILLISCSCWQSKTAYQEKLGHEPDYCKVPVVNLKTRKIRVFDFNK